jgi:hypothetical protein
MASQTCAAYTVSSLKTTRKTSAGPGSQFLFWDEIFALAKTRKTTLARIIIII